MKTASQPDRVGIDELLEVLLADERWQTAKADLQRQALGTLRTTRRRRQVVRWTGRIAAAAVVILLPALRWAMSSSPGDSAHAASASRPLSGSAPVLSSFVTEEQMLAMFPSGSCVVAEVDGQKELVFFDAKLAMDGFVLADAKR